MTKAIVFQGTAYTWQWDAADDIVRILDGGGHEIVSMPQLPLLEFADGTLGTGTVDDIVRDTGALRVRYLGPGALTILVTWRFDEESCWFEPIVVNDPACRPVRRLHLFAAADATPALVCSHVVSPGVSAGAGLSPVIDADARLSFTAWLGRGSTWNTGTQQQTWALPTHYFAGQSVHGIRNQRSLFANALSGAFCAGLADLPAADLRLTSLAGRYSVAFDYREDLWGVPADEPSSVRGATWCWVFAPHYRDAIRAYYRRLRLAGIATPREASPEKRATTSLTHFNTWGAQVVGGSDGDLLDQKALDDIWEAVVRSGLRPGCFIIDDKWEDRYGLLQHSADRLPEFEERLNHYRSAGVKVGLWAAFLRCEDPAAMGLEPGHMLCGPDGQPVVEHGTYADYYYPDVSRPVVAEALRRAARAFADRYRPDIVKFDFGYELPSLAEAAPVDRSLQGERFLELGLRTVVDAMREILPDLVVMYYSLSPLLIDSVDLHSIDDVWLCTEEYELEVNRRLYFSGLMGELGVASYGSGGYDWPSLCEIWFDTAVAGPIGSLGNFDGDVIDSRPTQRDIAKFNGLAALGRPQTDFEIRALRAPVLGASSAARSSSWARLESDELTMLALRPRHFDGTVGVVDYEDLVETTVQVVLSARDGRGIADCAEMGLVPFGDGVVHLSRASASGAQVATYLSSGAVRHHSAPVTDGKVVLNLSESIGHEAVEWVQVVFES